MSHPPPMLACPVPDDDTRNLTDVAFPNKIGGSMVIMDPSCQPHSDMLTCPSCKKAMASLLQIYAPLPSSDHHRNIHVLYCNSTSCIAQESGPARNMRALVSTSHADCPMYDLADTEDSDDQFLYTEEYRNAVKPSYPSFFKEVELETFEEEDHSDEEETESMKKEQNLLKQFKKLQDKGETITDKEAEEIQTDEDPTYEEFLKTLRKEPDQVLRYDYEGSPLLPCEELAFTPPPCSCGSDRQFELQITPQMVGHMEQVEDIRTETLDWDALLIYTCSKDCTNSESAWREETVYTIKTQKVNRADESMQEG